MGYAFISSEKEVGLCLDWQSWIRLLQLAKDFGWTPLGVVNHQPQMTSNDSYSPKFSLDKMDYISCYHQTVTYDDAQNLADALERAIVDLDDWGSPDFQIISVKGDVRKPESITAITIDFSDVHPTTYFCSDFWHEYIREFIDFCRCGSFIIKRYYG